MSSKFDFKLIPSVYLILVNNNQLLLSLRKNTGYRDGFWTLPVGHLNENETIFEAVIREGYEELGINIKVSDLQLVYTRQHLDENRIMFFF